MTAISKSMPAPAAPKPRTGPRCCCACMCAGPKTHGYKVEWLEESAGDERRDQIGDGQDQRPQRLWLAEDRKRRAPSGAHLAVRLERAAPYQLRLGLGLSGGRRQDRHRDQRQGFPHRHLSLLGRRRPARQQDRQRGAHHPSADRHRRAMPERALAAPEPGARLCDAARPALRGASCRSARPRPTR